MDSIWITPARLCDAAADAADARDKELAFAAEMCVQILADMKAPAMPLVYELAPLPK